METFAKWQRADNSRRLAVPARFPYLVTARPHPRSAHVWLTLPDRWRAEAFAASVAMQGISIAHTDSFVGRPHVTLHAVRLSIGAAADLSVLQAACDRIERLLGTAPRIGLEAA